MCIVLFCSFLCNLVVLHNFSTSIIPFLSPLFILYMFLSFVFPYEQPLLSNPHDTHLSSSYNLSSYFPLSYH